MTVDVMIPAATAAVKLPCVGPLDWAASAWNALADESAGPVGVGAGPAAVDPACLVEPSVACWELKLEEGFGEEITGDEAGLLIGERGIDERGLAVAAEFHRVVEGLGDGDGQGWVGFPLSEAAALATRVGWLPLGTVLCVVFQWRWTRFRSSSLFLSSVDKARTSV